VAAPLEDPGGLPGRRRPSGPGGRGCWWPL